MLLFTRYDTISITLLMDAFEEFLKSTSLSMNPAKCKVYFGNIDVKTKQSTQEMTKFSEGLPPFRYLGVPLTSKKISIHQCLILVDKLVARIRHWSVRLLNFAGIIQLIKSVLFVVTNFWMQCIPLPKRGIHNIKAICRSFVWTGGETICRISHIAWHNVCTPRNQGGQNIIFINE